MKSIIRKSAISKRKKHKINGVPANGRFKFSIAQKIAESASLRRCQFGDVPVEEQARKI